MIFQYLNNGLKNYVALATRMRCLYLLIFKPRLLHEDAAENELNWAVELLSSRRVILSATAAASCKDFRLPGIRDENPVEVSMVAPWENFPFFHLKMF